jgi:hypothetical protein
VRGQVLKLTGAVDDVFRMTNLSRTFYSTDPDSLEVGRSAGQSLLAQFGAEPIKAVLVYATINHEQSEVMDGLLSALGKDIPVIGCSVQGVVADGQLTEEGFALGVMGLGGKQLHAAVSSVDEFQVDSKGKGRTLARNAKSKLGIEPGAVVLVYDPLIGADMEALLAGMRQEVACPIVGGAAGQPWGPLVATFQYVNDKVVSRTAVALALSGPFAAEIGICSGTAPTGVAVTVTRAEGPMILELDGRPAVDVWREATGCERSEIANQSHNAAWALGVERRYVVDGPDGPTEQVARMMRCAFGFDMERGGVVFQAPIPVGTKVAFHHRTVEEVLGGTEQMGRELKERLGSRTPWAILGFECGARTYPYLGPARTAQEHEQLRQTVSDKAPWLGMMAWGEIGPCAGEPGFHNFTYPVLALVDRTG